MKALYTEYLRMLLRYYYIGIEERCGGCPGFASCTGLAAATLGYPASSQAERNLQRRLVII
jgi:hypothetical protein